MDIPDCYYRVSVKALVLNVRKEFLLLKEPNGNWDLPGGGLEFGDKPHDALKREVFEEMKIKVSHIASEPSYIVLSPMDRSSDWGCNIIYETSLDSFDFVTSDECVDVGFFSPEKATDLPLNKKVAEFIKLFDPNKHKL